VEWTARGIAGLKERIIRVGLELTILGDSQIRQRCVVRDVCPTLTRGEGLPAHPVLCEHSAEGAPRKMVGRDLSPTHYNRGSPHASLGPGIPDPLAEPRVVTGHHLAQHSRVIARPIVGGLHHEYHLAQEAA
jgi:hypothetical protein